MSGRPCYNIRPPYSRNMCCSAAGYNHMPVIANCPWIIDANQGDYCLLIPETHCQYQRMTLFYQNPHCSYRTNGAMVLHGPPVFQLAGPATLWSGFLNTMFRYVGPTTLRQFKRARTIEGFDINVPISRLRDAKLTAVTSKCRGGNAVLCDNGEMSNRWLFSVGSVCPEDRVVYKNWIIYDWNYSAFIFWWW